MRISNGGFFITYISDADIAHDFEEKCLIRHANIHKDSIGIYIGAWEEFPGQCLWVGKNGVVAHDLDLTNQQALQIELGLKKGESCKVGELIWRLYEQRGFSIFKHLRGAFAFSIWDKNRQEVIVVTDHYGIRPVVFCKTGNDFLAASRLRHVLLHSKVSRDLDHDAIYQYLYFSAIPTPRTIYKVVKKLEPGHYLRWNKNRIDGHKYYDIRYKPDESIDEQDWLQTIPSAISNAVERFVPLSNPEETGCFLSGGTDSSSVAGYYTKSSGQPTNTFSIGFDEPGYSEIHFADVASKHFGTIQHEYFVTPEDVLILLERLSDIYDEPFGNSSVIPTYYCARLAKDHGIDVLLAGDGGDEIFGGNERYLKNIVFDNYHRIPFMLRNKFLEPAIRALPGIWPFYKAQRYIRRANIPNPDRFYSYSLLYEEGLEAVFRPEFLETMNPNSFLELARGYYASATPASETDRLLYLDMKFTITDNDLRKVTQMTEYAGVRVRYPLLDQDLVDFTATIPPDLKVKPGRNRYIFKQAMKGFLPREIIEKEKHGFGLPVAPWFKNDNKLSRLLEDTLFDSSARLLEWIRPDFLNHMKDNFYGKDLSYYGANFWIFLMLELWLRKWMVSKDSICA